VTHPTTPALLYHHPEDIIIIIIIIIIKIGTYLVGYVSPNIRCGRPILAII